MRGFARHDDLLAAERARKLCEIGVGRRRSPIFREDPSLGHCSLDQLPNKKLHILNNSNVKIASQACKFVLPKDKLPPMLRVIETLTLLAQVFRRC